MEYSDGSAGTRLAVPRAMLILAGMLLFVDSLFGFVAMLGIGFDTFKDVLLVVCLTMAFPLFLTVFVSPRLATILLWIFFFAQWIDRCFLGRGFQFMNPFDGWYGDSLFLAAILMQIADVLLRRAGIRRVRDIL